MGVGGIHVGSSIRVILVEPGRVRMILSTGVGAIIVIIIITVGVSISIEIIVTIVPVSVVATNLAHVVGVVGLGTVECIPFTIIVGFTTVVVITITSIIHPVSNIPAKTVSIIMSNTFLCCTILGGGDCCTIEPLTSSMCLYGSTRWGDSASVVFKGAGCGMAVHVDVVVIVGIVVDIAPTTIITIVVVLTILILDIAGRQVGISRTTIVITVVVVITILSLDIAGRIVIVIVVGRVLDDALIP